MTNRRVVVTGLGLLAPHGNEPHRVFDALMAGRSAIGLWREGHAAPAAVAQTRFDPSPWFTKLQTAGVDRVSQMAVAAAQSAWDAAKYVPGEFDGERVGVFVGCGMGGAAAQDAAYAAIHAGRRVPPLTVVACMTNAPAANIAMRLGVLGPSITYSVACASSAVAISEAAKAIAHGEIDVAIAGGSEALIVDGVVKAWQALQTLANPGENPADACRPFDATRSGFVLGEGAAMLVLESIDHARARGAHMHAEFAGSGTSCDAAHLTKPDAEGQARALRNALRNARLTPDEVGYCNAHGTATLVGDVIECQALRAVWREHIDRLRVSATKSMHGHLLGAAGALEAIITVLALERREIPPTASVHSPDPACAVDIVRGRGVAVATLDAAISSSFAFGGTNVVLAFRRSP